MSFSPDSRKLYLQGAAADDDAPFYGDYLYQFDLDADDIYQSRTGLLIYNPHLDRDDFAAGLVHSPYNWALTDACTVPVRLLPLALYCRTACS